MQNESQGVFPQARICRFFGLCCDDARKTFRSSLSGSNGRLCGIRMGKDSSVAAERRSDPFSNLDTVYEACNNETGKEIVDAEDEVKIGQTRPNSILLRQSEIDDHCIEYFPYRSWCRWCVEGRGRETAHRLVDHVARSVAMIAFACVFAARQGCCAKEE